MGIAATRENSGTGRFVVWVAPSLSRSPRIATSFVSPRCEPVTSNSSRAVDLSGPSQQYA